MLDARTGSMGNADAGDDERKGARGMVYLTGSVSIITLLGDIFPFFLLFLVPQSINPLYIIQVE